MNRQVISEENSKLPKKKKKRPNLSSRMNKHVYNILKILDGLNKTLKMI